VARFEPGAGAKELMEAIHLQSARLRYWLPWISSDRHHYLSLEQAQPLMVTKSLLPRYPEFYMDLSFVNHVVNLEVLRCMVHSNGCSRQCLKLLYKVFVLLCMIILAT
jgi:hypothetical protein